MSSEDNARCVSSHAEDLADGRTVAPGQFFKLSVQDLAQPHNARLVEAGKIIVVHEPQQEVLQGDALDQRAKELDIPGRSGMSADDLRKAVAEAEDNKEGEGS